VSLQAELRAYRDAVPGCLSAVLVDLESGFAVAGDSDAPADFDLIAAATVEVLTSAAAAKTAEVMAAPLSQASVVGAGSHFVFQRLGADPDFALGLEIDPEAEAPEVMAAARAASVSMGVELW
jgi:predicted regulator of Ras-like GTPase activity (Roadblock/LC7/MglB family)